MRRELAGAIIRRRGEVNGLEAWVLDHSLDPLPHCSALQFFTVAEPYCLERSLCEQLLQMALTTPKVTLVPDLDRIAGLNEWLEPRFLDGQWIGIEPLDRQWIGIEPLPECMQCKVFPTSGGVIMITTLEFRSPKRFAFEKSLHPRFVFVQLDVVLDQLPLTKSSFRKTSVNQRVVRRHYECYV